MAWSLKLVACRLRLGQISNACCLKLDACCLGPGLPTEERYRLAPLMFAVCNVLNIFVPAGPAVQARVPLVRSWAASTSCNDRGRQGPGARRGPVYLRRAKPYCQVSWHPVLRDLRKEPGLPRGKPVRHVRR